MSDQTTTTNPSLDLSTIDPGEFPARENVRLTDKRQKHFQAVMCRSVLDEIHTHGQSITDAEICGVMVGNVYHDKYGPYLRIHASVRGDKAEGHAAQVTFTAETWNHINDVMDREHPDARIVGWYHTHPGFGIFLSGMDLFIQDNFFNLPWQVAFVYDPIGGDEGMFFWRKGKSERERILIEEPGIDDARGQPGHLWKAKKHTIAPSGGRSMKGVISTALMLFFMSFVGMYLYLYLNPNGLDPVVSKVKQWKASLSSTQPTAQIPTTAPSAPATLQRR